MTRDSDVRPGAHRSGPPARRRFDRRAFLLFVPNGYEIYARRADADIAVALRSIIVVITLGFGAFGAALAAVVQSTHAAVAPWFALLGVLTVSNYVMSRFITTRPLDCTSDTNLAAGYVSAVCLRITFAASLGLFAYSFAVIAGQVWIYVVGGTISVFWLWLDVAPTQRAIARDQRRISTQGCARSLVVALRVESP